MGHKERGKKGFVIIEESLEHVLFVIEFRLVKFFRFKAQIMVTKKETTIKLLKTHKKEEVPDN